MKYEQPEETAARLDHAGWIEQPLVMITAAEADEKEAEMSRLRERVAALEVALAFYADGYNYTRISRGGLQYATGFIHDYDRGTTARLALEAQ